MTDWRNIVAEHGATVWRTAYRILVHHADAADCYQDTFVAAFRSLGREPIREWAAYLTALATRKAIDRLRDRNRRKVLFAALDDAPESFSQSNPVEQAAADELLDRLRSALAELPDTQATVFWLSCIEGLTGEQIATQLRTTPGAVRAILHRARVALAPKFAASATQRRTTDD